MRKGFWQKGRYWNAYDNKNGTYSEDNQGEGGGGGDGGSEDRVDILTYYQKVTAMPCTISRTTKRGDSTNIFTTAIYFSRIM